MRYRIEILDSNGCYRVGVENTPLFEISAHAPGGRVIARGLLPADMPGLEGLAPGWRVHCIVDGVVMGEATIGRVNEQWSDMRKLVLDRYVPFHRICEIEADSQPDRESAWVSGTYENLSISAILRDLVQRAAGKVYCTVEHTGYPAGAQREYQKFLARKSESNELQVGGIASGDWVGPGRIDATQASARDGDTISGLIVDGVAWPDVRLLMIDAEEMTRNTHAIKRHPEVGGWTSAHYLESPYRLRAVRARDALQAMITSGGIQYIELRAY
jgi:hypothetical protein